MRLGIPYEVWGRDKISKELGWSLDSFGPPKPIDDPDFGIPSETARIDGGIMFPTSGFVSDPALAVHNLKTAAEHHNVTFITNTAVTGVAQARGRVTGVQLGPNRRLDCGVVVNAAGPYSSRINAMAFSGDVPNDSRITTRPLRQEVAYVPAPAHLATNWITIDLDCGFYMRPDVEGKILIGSVEPKCDPLHWVHTHTNKKEERKVGGGEGGDKNRGRGKGTEGKGKPTG